MPSTRSGLPEFYQLVGFAYSLVQIVIGIMDLHGDTGCYPWGDTGFGIPDWLIISGAFTVSLRIP